MREYENRTVRELQACTCDRCGRRMRPHDPPGSPAGSEWNGKLSLDWDCGYGSAFGDGAHVSLDLCQHCARDVLGAWLRITSGESARVTGSLPIGALAGIVRHTGDPVPVDAMHPGNELVATGPAGPRKNRQAQPDLIDRAAALLGKRRTDFIQETAYERAQAVVLDQVFFSLDGERHRKFLELLDAPSPATPGREQDALRGAHEDEASNGDDD